MLKALSLLLCGALLFVGIVTPVAQKPIERGLKASVVVHIKVLSKDENGKPTKGYGGCSGTFVTPKLIITAAHCFAEPGIKNIWARGPYEQVGYPCKLILYDRKNDLALLEAPFKHPYARIGPLPKRGDRIINIGSPYSFEFVLSEGIVGMTAFTIQKLSAKFLVTTAMANPGSSGGGVFNQNGQLVGVISMSVGLFGWQGLSMAVNTDTINTFLGVALKYYHPEEEE